MPVGGIEFFGEFQSEHNLSQTLFADTERARVLRLIGYERDQASNRRALFTSTDIVGQLENDPSTAAYKQLLRRSGWGPVLHRGGDTTVGGYLGVLRAGIGDRDPVANQRFEHQMLEIAERLVAIARQHHHRHHRLAKRLADMRPNFGNPREIAGSSWGISASFAWFARIAPPLPLPSLIVT